MSETTVKGLAELQRALDTLPAKIEANIVRGALRAGAKIILAEAQRLVPVEPPSGANARLYGGREGLLRDSLRVGTKIDSRKAQVVATVKVGGKAKGGGDAYYAKFVEFGTAPHVIRAKNGKMLALGVSKVNHPGAKKKPFLRPAMDTQMMASVEAVRDYIRNRLASKHGIDVPAPIEEGDE